MVPAQIRPSYFGGLVGLLLTACAAGGSNVSRLGSSVAAAGDRQIPASESQAAARLEASSRHGEWAVVPVGEGDSVRAWVVYPERSTPAPVVVVIHEIFGLTTWVRAVTDQVAADGFVAIAPDLLTGKRLPMPPDEMSQSAQGLDSAIAVISALDYGQVLRRIAATGRYGLSLPAAQPRWGVIGFCWGGALVLATTGNVPDVGAAVVYYGGLTPEQASLAEVRAPTLGLFADNDARVNVLIPYADSSYRAAGATFESHIYPGAGHGFVREQTAQDGANLLATRDAWPRMLAWLRRYLEK